MSNVTASREVTKSPVAVQWVTASRKYVVELIGSFFLVFTVGASAFSGSAFTPLAAGAVLMVMIYAGGHISGGHYNPAVTLAVLARGRIGLRDAASYWIAQFAGGLIAAEAARAIVNPAHVNRLTLSGHALTAAALVSSAAPPPDWLSSCSTLVTSDPGRGQPSSHRVPPMRSHRGCRLRGGREVLPRTSRRARFRERRGRSGLPGPVPGLRGREARSAGPCDQDRSQPHRGVRQGQQIHQGERIDMTFMASGSGPPGPH
jgi:hypothetical protein